MIVRDEGLHELLLALKMSRIEEVRNFYINTFFHVFRLIFVTAKFRKITKTRNLVRDHDVGM